MSYFREGIELGDNFVWGSGSFFLGFANGTWTPQSATIADVVLSEVARVSGITPVVQWNNTTSRNEIIINTTITPTQDINFNRTFIIKDGSAVGSWTVSAVPAGDTVTIVGQDFALTERFVLQDTGDELTVTNIVSDDVTFTGQSRNFLITDIILDARGTFLAAASSSQNTVFFNGTSNVIDIQGESITT